MQIELLASLGGSWTLEDACSWWAATAGSGEGVDGAIPDGGSPARRSSNGVRRGDRGPRREVAFRPGARELLLALRKAGVPCALVSASYRLMIDAVLTHLPPDPFDVIVAGDEVTHGKPHPEPYLTAAAKLGVDPAQCVVIEDSNTGTESGTAAGAYVVAVPQWVTIPEAPRRLVVDSLEPLSPEALRDLLR